MYDEIIELIKKEEFKIAEQKLNEILNNEALSNENQAKAHYLIGYINTIFRNKDKNEYVAKSNLLDNIRSDYSNPKAYVLYSNIEKDKNIAINYLEDGLKRFTNHPMLLESLFKLVDDIDKKKILNQIDTSGLVDYDLFTVILEYLIEKENWNNVKKYSKKLLESYELSPYARNYIELVEVYSNILGESEYNSDLIISKLQRIIKTDLDNDLKYSPSEVYGIYRYNKKDLLTLSNSFKNSEFNMHIAIALYYMKIHFAMYDEAFEVFLNILQNVNNFKGYTISSAELFEKANNDLLIKMSERTKEFMNESDIYIKYHEELKEFIKDLVEILFERKLFKEIITLIDNIPISILNKLGIAFDVAYSYAELGQNNTALKIYEKILSTNPNDSSSLNNVSLLYEDLGNFNKAFEYIKKAKEIKEDNINKNNFERIKNKLDKSNQEKREKENLKIQSICRNLNLNKMEEIGYDKNLKDKLNKISDNELKQILLRDLKECAYSVLLEQNKSAIVISGSIIEAILIYKIKIEGTEEYDLIGLRNRKKTCVKSIDSMILDELLYVANKLEILSDTNYYLSHFSREYRNVIHPIYPMKALREAIANALVHRDYSSNSDGSYIYLRIFDDRIEILNPGELYGNNKLENLGTDKKMEVRNNVIIRLLEETTDVVENRHTGVATMREEMKKAKLPEPEFEILRGTFKVTFRKEIQEIVENNYTEKENCTEKELKLLELLKNKPNITQLELSNDLNISRRTVSTILAGLKEKKKIERVGSDRKGYWKILK